MRTLVWLADGTWEACVDAARDHDGEITLLYVVDSDTVAALNGAAGLLGRDAPVAGPEPLTAAADAILRAAAERLGRPSQVSLRRGRPEREVVAACADADTVIVARDGGRLSLDPRSLGHATRYVVDHAPCTVVLIWP